MRSRKANTMNAAEARKKRGGSTLLERTMADAARAERIKRLVELAEIERIVENVRDYGPNN